MPTAGMAELIVAKHRNGPVDSVKTRYIGQYTKFADLDTFDQDMGSSGSGYNKDLSNSAIVPNTDFDNPSTSVIRGSKMNDIEEDHPF